MASRTRQQISITDQGRDMYGQTGDVRERILDLYETCEEAGGVAREKLKAQAIAKLTTQERAALDL